MTELNEIIKEVNANSPERKQLEETLDRREKVTNSIDNFTAEQLTRVERFMTDELLKKQNEHIKKEKVVVG